MSLQSNLPCGAPALLEWCSERALLISDLHLCAATPLGLAAFERLLENMQDYDSLLILGDLFEVYLGDDALVHDHCVQHVARLLKKLSLRCQIGIMHGNRDFLLGSGFCVAAGAQLLADPCVLSTERQMAQASVLMSHGDSWCTADLKYQATKQIIRSPEWQSRTLAASWAQRTNIAAQARAQSMGLRGDSAVESTRVDYDVQTIDFEVSCKRFGANRAVHGHTHLPAQHVGQPQRTVLGDWQFDVSAEHAQPSGNAAVATWEAKELQLCTYDGHVLSGGFA